MTQHHSLRYQAYLVRFWQEGAATTWRASAQHVQSGETFRFADIGQLFAFLQARLLNATESEPTVGDSEGLSQLCSVKPREGCSGLTE